MKRITETPRLYFREFDVEDANSLFLLNEDPEVIRYTGDPPFENSEAARKFILDYDHYEKHGFGRWAVVKKEDDQFIGWCGLKYNEEEEIDIGFRFFQKEWGKGYATESAKAIIKYGIKELKMTHFIGRAAKDNIASVKILEKLGFSFQKQSECHGISDALYFTLEVK